MLSLKIRIFINLQEGKKSKITIDYAAGRQLRQFWSKDVKRRLKERLGIFWKKRVTRFTQQENIKNVELFTAVLSADPVLSHSSLLHS